MELLIALCVFFTVACAAYGFLAKTPVVTGVQARLGTLRYERPKVHDEVPDPAGSFVERVLRPNFRMMVRKVNQILPTNMSDKMQGAISRAGLKIAPGQLLVIIFLIGGIGPALFAAFLLLTGGDPQMTLILWGALTFMGLYGPRIWINGRVKKRKKEIWRSLPDAFDLVTASVEAGLGIDAAFNRIIEKVHGPFAEELIKTMREITMGRSRREAFMEMAERSGVDELSSLIGAIVQAETMGISIGSVIRVQTGVLRTKRKQKAEEQAFKAPVKMVFPLVLFIFPCIMVVIGGPAIIQMKDSF
jgi:tight adherence protein C